MRNILILAQKELKSYFISPIAYVIATVFLIITGYYFYTSISAFSMYCFKLMSQQKAIDAITISINISVFRGAFNTMTSIIMFMMPIITMRILAEERRNKTLELLMTSPISTFEIIIGKFLAAFILFALIVSLTLYMPVYASIYSNLDWGSIITSYIGILLIGCVFLSIGFFASSLTENQIVAALISFVIILMLVLIQRLASQVDGALAVVLNYLALSNHLINFYTGIISSRDVLYYLSITFFGLFLTFIIVESKRWKR